MSNPNEATSFSDSGASSVTIRTQNSITTSLNYPTLSKSDAESIRVFLRKYDQYAVEVRARHQQLVSTQDESFSSEPARPIALKFCADTEWLLSTLALGLIKDTQGNPVSSYDTLTDEVLRVYLDGKAAASKEVVTISTLDDVIERKLRMDMSDPGAKSRMESLFTSYYTILRQHGLIWVVNDAQKVAVQHVLSQIRPSSLQQRLKDDLELSHYQLRKDFNGFFAHAVKLAEAFQIVDNGPRRRSKGQNKYSENKNNSSNHGSRDQTQNIAVTKRSQGTKKKSKKLPPCPFPPCVSKNSLHYIKDCPESNNSEKAQMRADIAAKKAATGPHANTRSRAKEQSKLDKEEQVAAKTGRIHTFKDLDPASITAAVSQEKSERKTLARCDDGSDDSLVCPTLAEPAALSGIGRIRAIEPVKLKVALHRRDEKVEFSFSRQWIVPNTILQLRTGSMGIQNMSFLISDDRLTGEPLIIGRPALQHMRVDTKTLLEERYSELNGIDCSSIGNPTMSSKAGYVSRLMISRVQDAPQGNKARVKNSDAKPIATTPIALHNPDRPRVSYFDSRNEKDPFPDCNLLDPVDSDQQEEVLHSVQAMIAEAKKNGLPPQYHERLKSIILKHIDVFRIGMSGGPPADIPPMIIKLTPHAKATRVKLRNYSQSQRDFLSQFVNSLLDKNMAYPNPYSAWASAPLCVPKPGPSNFLFTVDLRPVNKFTIKHAYPMPNLEQELHKLSGSKCYANFDLSQAYWQLSLHENSQECQSFITPDGVYSPTRVLHGTANAVAHLQSALAAIFLPELGKNLLSWLDDLLLYASCPEELLTAIESFLSLCLKHRLKLHPQKCILFTVKIKWCGRIITRQGIRFDPSATDALLSMEPPTNGAQLQQLLCAMQWVRTAIPKFSKVISELQEMMENAYQKAGKRTKRAVAKISLAAMKWEERHTESFERCKKALANQCTLTYRDNSKRLCLYTDSSDTVWSGILTQVPHMDLELPFEKQRHEPLAFLSGRFDDTEMRWAIIEKEAYAVKASCERMRWLLGTPDGFNLYTDHNNLIFIFDPLSLVPDLSASSVKKVLRWAVSLSTFNYVCFHIPGTKNVWADLLGRWSAPAVVRRLIEIPPLVSASDEDFVWPTEVEISQVQEAHRAQAPLHLNDENGLLRDQTGAIWIPPTAGDIQLRLCIIAHTSAAGHRGIKSTKSELKKIFFWDTLSEDVDTFVAQCIHCLSTTRGVRVPRPFGPAVHGTRPNELIQFDYLEIGPSAIGSKYLLLVRDDFSSYSWLFPFHEATAENAAEAILEWSAAFNTPSMLMSDGGSHFQNETLRIIAQKLRAKHHITLPYTPWSNGAIERLCKEVLRVFRALTSELRLEFQEWPDLVQVVQSVLNNSPSPQRRDIAPVTVFTGLPAKTPVTTFLRSSTQKIMSVQQAQHESALNLGKTKQLLDELHPVVANTLAANRARARKSAERGELPRFAKGDFVLVAREDFFHGEKLALRWRGPRRIVQDKNDFVYTVEDLRNGTTADVHACRLKFYCDSSLNKIAILPHVLSSETGMPVARLMGLEDTENGIMVHVRWRGLPNTEDTLEPLQQVYDDVPQMLMRLLLRKSTPKALVQRAKAALTLTSERGV